MTYNYEDYKLDSRISLIMCFLDRHVIAEDRNELEAFIRAYACPKDARKNCDGVKEHAKCRKCWDGESFI